MIGWINIDNIESEDNEFKSLNVVFDVAIKLLIDNTRLSPKMTLHKH